MLKKFTFLYNLWLLLAQGQILLAQPNLPGATISFNNWNHYKSQNYFWQIVYQEIL